MTARMGNMTRQVIKGISLLYSCRCITVVTIQSVQSMTMQNIARAESAKVLDTTHITNEHVLDIEASEALPNATRAHTSMRHMTGIHRRGTNNESSSGNVMAPNDMAQLRHNVPSTWSAVLFS